MIVLRSVDRGVRWLLRHTASAVPPLVHAYDTQVIRYRMRRGLGYKPDLRNPRTYNEKLAWRILHDRNPLFVITADKVMARDYVARKVGPEILVPLIGVYEHAIDIPWEALPGSFALKASHGYDMNLLIHDKSAVDRDAVLRQAAAWLRHNYYESSREWAYRGIKPRLLIEELLVDEHGNVPLDLKFLVFHGRTAVIRIHLDRFGQHRANLYDADLRLLPVRQKVPVDPSYTPVPKLREMARLAERLAEDFDYARIDLYLVRDQIRFGEITHYDGAAATYFEPPDYDRILGELWRLPTGKGLAR
jgi:TupA-like ATPgrasp